MACLPEILLKYTAYVIKFNCLLVFTFLPEIAAADWKCQEKLNN